MKKTWFTICANNYLGYALTLYHSLRSHHPDANFKLFLADTKSDNIDYAALPFEVITAHSLPIPTFSDMTLRYDVMELATAIKPSCFKMLFNNNSDAAIYLDPDIFVTAPMKKIIAALEAGAEAIFTPHILKPYADQNQPDVLQILKAGTLNLGFAAFSKGSQTKEFLNWWENQLRKDGHNDLVRGTFVDQKYADLAPSFIENTVILHDRGYNAAYWNIHERTITKREQDWFADHDPLSFFHFSGVVPEHPEIFSKHQNRYDINNIGDLRILLDHYHDTLNQNEHTRYTSIPYAYNQFSTGEFISPLMRKTYSAYADNSACEAFNNSQERNYRHDLFTQSHTEHKLPALLVEAWLMKPDLQKAFNLHHDAERSGYKNWFKTNGAQAFTLPENLVDALIKPSQSRQHKSNNLLTKSATKILNTAPTLRPFYKHIPVHLRSAVKTALYRTHQKAGLGNNQLKISAANKDIDTKKSPGVHFYGYVRSQSGIGQGARGLIKALRGQSLPLAVSSLANPNDPREAFPFPEVAAPNNGFRISLINANAEQVLILEELLNPRQLDHVYRIAYWVWELGNFPNAFIPALDRVDEIWVPSKFVADSLKAVTNKPVHILPYSVTAEDPAALTRQHFGLPADRTVFLTAFDVNSFLKRKNPTASIQAFIDAFDANSPNSPVLAIKVHGSKGYSDARNTLQNHIGEAPNIVIVDQTLKRDEYLSLHFQADAFVSLHRSEGFGLNLAEAMLIGKPVIATGWSGNQDFMTPENSIPVGFELIDVAPGEYPHWEGQQWANPNHAEAVKALQKLAYDAGTRERLGKAGQNTIINQYSDAVTGLAMRKRLEQIDPHLAKSTI